MLLIFHEIYHNCYTCNFCYVNNQAEDALTGMERDKVLTVASELLKTSEFSEDQELLNFHIFTNVVSVMQQVRVRTSDLFLF